MSAKDAIAGQHKTGQVTRLEFREMFGGKNGNADP